MSIFETQNQVPERPLDGPLKDDLLYRWVRNVLVYGMLTSFVLMLAGIVFFIMLHTGDANVAIALPDLLPRAAALDPLGVAALGVLVLALVPGLSVLTSFICFAVERDFKFALVSFGVLIILALSIAFAL